MNTLNSIMSQAKKPVLVHNTIERQKEINEQHNLFAHNVFFWSLSKKNVCKIQLSRQVHLHQDHLGVLSPNEHIESGMFSVWGPGLGGGGGREGGHSGTE